jgi:aryl-alcohol dehydrogenase-like predicted oxidoreductase
MSFGNQMNWMVEESEAKQIIKRAWALGINLFDIAHSYSKGRSEEILGNFIAGNDREEAVIETKVYNPWAIAPIKESYQERICCGRSNNPLIGGKLQNESEL